MCSGPVKCQQYGWAKELLDTCPPAAVEVPNPPGAYRFVQTVPPTALDFLSYRELYPDRDPPPGTTECEYRSVSLFLTLERCRKLRGHNMFKGKSVVRLALTQHSGAIQRGKKAHVSWWGCAGFDPIGASGPAETL